MLDAQPAGEDQKQVRNERRQQPDLLLVDDDVDQEREHGEEQIVGELQPEENLQVQAGLELVVPHEKLCHRAGRGHGEHQSDEHQREPQVLAEEEHRFGNRRGVHALAQARVALPPYELAGEVEDEERHDHPVVVGREERSRQVLGEDVVRPREERHSPVLRLHPHDQHEQHRERHQQEEPGRARCEHAERRSGDPERLPRANGDAERLPDPGDRDRSARGSRLGRPRSVRSLPAAGQAPAEGGCGAVGEAEPQAGAAENRRGDAEPEEPVQEHRPFEGEHPDVLLDDRPLRHHLVHDGDEADRIEQFREGRLAQREIDDEGDGDREEHEQHAAEVARHAAPAEQGGRELYGGRDEGVGQRDERERSEVGGRPEGTDDRGIHAGGIHREKAAGLHAEQDERVQHEGREEAASEELRLADGHGVDQRVHPRLNVPRSRLAGGGGRHEQPDQAAEDRDGRDDERRVEDEVLRQGDGDHADPRVHEGEDEEDTEGEPGPRSAQLAGELEADDLEELHIRPSDSFPPTRPRLSSVFRSIRRWKGSMPARSGFRGTVTVIVWRPERIRCIRT